MNIINFAIARWQITLVVFALLVAIGLSSFFSIPRSVDPHFPSPFIIVVATVPGAEPSDIETTIAKPIEDVLQGVDGIVKVASTNTDSSSVITAEFSWDDNPEKKYDEVVREVNAIRGTLPSALQRLEFRRSRTTEAAILQFALVSDTASYRRLEKLGKDLRERMNRVPGVRETRVWGIPRPEVTVALDLGRMAQLGLPVTAVTDALRQGSTDLPPGAVHSGDQRLNVQAGGAFKSVGEIADEPVRARDGSLIRVRDVAQVGWGYEEQPHIARYNGKRAVWVTLQQKDNLNVLDIRNDAVAAAEAFRAQLPPDVTLELGFDQSLDIGRKLATLARDFGIALLLVLITLLPLGLRASLVVMVSVPLSLAIGVAVRSFTGFTRNQLAISGFIIAPGLLVDDSIGVTENIARHLREGEDRMSAAISGTREIAVAVLGCTFVLLFAFLPLAFLPEGAGKFTRSLPVAVLGTVAASLLVSLTIVPFLASRILPRTETEHGNRFLQAVQKGIQTFYAPILHWSLERPWRAMAIATGIVISGFGLVPFIGSSLFPPADAPYFLVTVRAPEGAAITQTERATRFVEAALKDEPLVQTLMTNIGRGNPQIFYNQRSFDQRTNLGEVFVVLEEWDQYDGPALVERLRARLDTSPDAQYTVKIFQNGPPIAAPILVRICGHDFDVLKRLETETEARRLKVPGTRDVRTPVATDQPRLDLGLDSGDVNNPIATDQPRLDLGLDSGKAALLGVVPGAPRRILRLSLAGEAAGRFRDNEGGSYDVVLRLPLVTRQPVPILDQV
ncbi:multidrug transporter AcrB [Polymorphobacter multimanifer]|uniref:efflux RND transporter permease subunit n=1 Tax=Polymorphobacter multimanifer TaxID=1070431 RepID=UPI00199E1B1E|nr:efflux RND transporter permease subunit [Polymorphobacter multimanifer]GGI81390.1 multidrug transporter AcrB [Polymorphobacter multimanifer]